MNEHEIDTVVVGAGPIGLLNAIGLKKKDPNRKIVILEKRPEYSRSHVARAQAGALEKFITTCGGEDEPILTDLVKQLKKNPAIRINELEGKLKELAIQLGIEIKYGEVNDVQKQIFDVYPNVALVIGADGTHSTVSKQIFGEENQEKHPFDYVLQVRFEIETPEGIAPQRMDLPNWAKYLEAYGVTGEEVIGKTKIIESPREVGEEVPQQGGVQEQVVEITRVKKTPVTMQLMISQEDFETLYHPEESYGTSKDPIKPFDENDQNTDKLPRHILEKIKGYMGLRLKHYTDTHSGETIDFSNIRISVNEAPATRAKSVIEEVQVNDDRTVCVMLTGDAALGLSYFKGLNAGFKNATKAFEVITSDINEREEKLNEYSEWFEEFSSKKVQEVADFSKWGARFTWKMFSFFNRIFGSNLTMDTLEAEAYTDLYLGYLKDRAINKNNHAPFNPYPHSKKDTSPILFFVPVPVTKRLREVGEYFREFGESFKSPHYFLKDFFHPLRAVYNVVAGAAKVGFALPIFLIGSIIDLILDSLTGKIGAASFRLMGNSFLTCLARIGDGIAQIIEGGLLAIITVLEPFKLITRGILSIIDPAPKIEDNRKIRKLLGKAENENLTIQEVNALRVDLHLKYEKALRKGQKTNISPEEEQAAFDKCKLEDPSTYQSFFELFERSNLENSEETQEEREEEVKEETIEEKTEKVEGKDNTEEDSSSYNHATSSDSEDSTEEDHTEEESSNLRK